jgi:SPP1 family predicted phage head-tail adaptor
MKPGKLRHRVTIQSPSRAADGQSGYATTWVDVATVHAEITSLSSSSGYDIFQLYPQASHQVKIRYRSGISTQNRLLFGSRVFLLQGWLNPQERNRELLLATVEQQVGATV